MSKSLQVKQIDTDVLIIGGGTAGCYAALTISRNSDASVLVAEKANIKRAADKFPQAQLVLSAKAKAMLPQFFDIAHLEERCLVVKEGDTLSTIVWRQYHTLKKMNMVKRVNRIQNSDNIREGQVIKLPAR